ncbi:DUF58 domain-containing protein [Candidatus Woesearchaeota archaeon]|nr:DUF58 domain-containing protein [Candidatus Woesearchaeota archaeon]
MKKLKLDIKDLANRLDLSTRKMFMSNLSGNYQTAFKGSGLEFYGFRKYDTSDDASKIDWKASSRANDLLVREYVEERSLNVFFLVDASSTMLFGTREKIKAQYAAELVASLSFAIVHSSDAVGLGMFNKSVVRNFLPASGEKQYYNILSNLVDLNLYGNGFDLAKPLRYYTGVLPRGSLFFIVSDFIGLKGDEWVKNLGIACRKFDVVGIMIRDVRDRQLPDDYSEIVLESPEDDRKKIVNPAAIKQAYESYVKREEERISEIFSECGGGEFLQLTTEMDFVKPIVKMFKRRVLKYR